MQKTNETFLREALYDAIYAATYSPEKEYGIYFDENGLPYHDRCKDFKEPLISFSFTKDFIRKYICIDEYLNKFYDEFIEEYYYNHIDDIIEDLVERKEISID